MAVAFSTISSSKTLASILAAALITGGGTAVAAAATGTNPVVLAQQLPAAVVSCKDQLAAGQHGIGGCVSDFVQTSRSGSAGTTARTSPASGSAASPSARELYTERALLRIALRQLNSGMSSARGRPGQDRRSADSRWA